MNKLAIAWILLLAFAAFNNYAVYRMLTQRGRVDLFWISLIITAIPIALFALWPGAFTLLSFPLLQSLGLWLLLRLVSQPR